MDLLLASPSELTSPDPYSKLMGAAAAAGAAVCDHANTQVPSKDPSARLWVRFESSKVSKGSQAQQLQWWNRGGGGGAGGGRWQK